MCNEGIKEKLVEKLSTEFLWCGKDWHLLVGILGRPGSDIKVAKTFL